MAFPRVWILVGVWAALTARADVTAREATEVKLSPAFPAAMAETLRQQMGGSLQNQTTIQVKNGRCLMPAGAVESITDTAQGTATLLDSKSRQFATLPLADYREKMTARAVAPAQAKLLQSVTFHVSEAQKTGESAEIQGARADQYLIVVTIQAGPATTRLEIRMWATPKEETDRVPGLKELAGCSMGPEGQSDAVQSVQKLLTQFPGLSDKLNGVIESLKHTGLLLKTQLSIFSPAGELTPALQIGTELQELSTAALPEANFAVPADYQEASPATLLALMQPPVQSTAVQAPASLPDGVKAPVPVYSPAPKYTDEALLAKIEGTVTLLIEVNETGAARVIRVLRPLDPGLDQRAAEVVSQWKFNPGEKDGRPIAVQATVQVSFRLSANQAQGDNGSSK